MQITVKFYGYLRKFGNDFKLVDVANSSEALNALYCQINGLRKAIQTHRFFKVKLGKRYFTMPTIRDDVLQEMSDGDVLHVIPVIGGSGGAVQFVVGAVLSVVSVVGFAFGWTGIGAVVGTIGVGLMASGVAQMLTKTPSPDNPNRNETEKKQSTSFSNLQNLVAQGRPVPLAYGRIMIGSLIIGKGVETLNIQLYKPNPQVTYTTGFRGLSI